MQREDSREITATVLDHAQHPLQAACADLLEYGLGGPGLSGGGASRGEARGAGPEGGHAGRSGERTARGNSGGGPGCV
jgi:hypothetical protein